MPPDYIHTTYRQATQGLVGSLRSARTGSEAPAHLGSVLFTLNYTTQDRACRERTAALRRRQSSSTVTKTTKTSPGLTGRDADVGAGPELLRVGTVLPADGPVELDPLVLAAGALSRPRCGLELVVPDVLAGVSGV